MNCVCLHAIKVVWMLMFDNQTRTKTFLSVYLLKFLIGSVGNIYPVCWWSHSGVFLCRYTCRGLFEVHKLLFSFQMCAKILEVAGKLNMDEYSFFLRGGLVRKLTTYSCFCLIRFKIIQQDIPFVLKAWNTLNAQKGIPLWMKSSRHFPKISTAISGFILLSFSASEFPIDVLFGLFIDTLMKAGLIDGFASRFSIGRIRWTTPVPVGWWTPAGTTSQSWISCQTSMASWLPLNSTLKTGTVGSPVLSQRILHFQVRVFVEVLLFFLRILLKTKIFPTRNNKVKLQMSDICVWEKALFIHNRESVANLYMVSVLDMCVYNRQLLLKHQGW